MSENSQASADGRVFLLVLTIVAIVAGIYLRLKGINNAPFTVDEYYIATSVNNIVEKGIPEFDCGGLYTRGIIYQYLLAPLFASGVDQELYARLVTVACNILAAPALYLLAKNISGKTVAYSVLILFFLSIWEIEFSRFARMYSPFQMLFLWHLYFLHKWTFLEDKNARFWCFFISLLSVFVYEGGVFLVLFNFLPAFMKTKYCTKLNISFSTGILAIAATYLTTNFRFPNAETMPGEPQSQIIIPPILASSIDLNSIWMILYVLLSCVVLYAGARLIRQLYSTEVDSSVIYKAIIISAVTILALLNAYTLMVCVVALALTLNWVNLKEILSKQYAFVAASVFLMLGFWLAYGVLTDDWINAVGSEQQASIKQLLISLFKYPDIYNKAIAIFLQTIPVFTIACILIIFAGILSAGQLDKNKQQAQLFLLAVVLILVMLISMLRQPYISTRYFFFFYPILILLISLSFHNVLNRLHIKQPSIIIAPLLLFMFFSEDNAFNHYKNIDKDEIIYRMSYNDEVTDHLYARWDYRSPASFINDNRKATDIVVTTTNVTPYYLEQLDFFYHDHNRDNFRNIVGCGGERSLWVDAQLISYSEDLLSIIDDSETTVWLIAKSTQYKWLTPVEKKINDKFSNNIAFTSVDGNLNVYRISKTKL